MSTIHRYLNEPLSLTQLKQRSGLTLVELGAEDCRYCQAAAPWVRQLINEHPTLNLLKIADAPTRLFARRLRVTHWPTLILFNAGQEIARCVRPTCELELSQAFSMMLISKVDA